MLALPANAARFLTLVNPGPHPQLTETLLEDGSAPLARHAEQDHPSSPTRSSPVWPVKDDFLLTLARPCSSRIPFFLMAVWAVYGGVFMSRKG